MKDWNKLKVDTAAELLVHFELADEASAQHLVPDTHPRVTVERLMDAACFLDAVKLLAHGLPKREAVWWACLAARAVQRPDTDKDNMDALLAAEAWAKKPTEDNRQLARALGIKTGHKTAASWAATAAAWSAGSLSAPAEPPVVPPEYLYAHAVAGAVSLAAVLADPEDPAEKYRLFLAQGIDLACGGNGVLQVQGTTELAYG